MWEACGLIGEGGRAAAVDHERIVEQRASSIREVWTGLEMWSQWRGERGRALSNGTAGGRADRAAVARERRLWFNLAVG